MDRRKPRTGDTLGQKQQGVFVKPHPPTLSPVQLVAMPTEDGRTPPNPAHVPAQVPTHPSTQNTRFVPPPQYGQGRGIPSQYYAPGYAQPGLNAYPMPSPYGIGYNPYSSFPTNGAPGNPRGGGALRGPYNPGQPNAQVPQRPTQPSVSIPARRSKALAIVNPDTNEEIKISKVDSKPAPIASSPPVVARKPVTLAPDPADSASTSSAAPAPARGKVETVDSTKTPDASRAKPVPVPVVSEPSAAEVPAAVPADVPALKSFETVPTKAPTPTAKKNEQTAAAPEASQSSAVPSVTPVVPPPVVPPTSEIPPSVIQGANNGVSGPDETAAVVEAPVAAVAARTSTGSAPATKSVQPVGLAIAAAPKETTASETSISGKLTELSTDNVATSSEGRSTINSEVNATLSGSAPVVDASKEAVEKSSTSASATEDAPQSPPRRERPAILIFEDGERRVYPSNWILDMRPSANVSMLAEYEAALLKSDISKSRPGGGGNQRGGDPRGTRSTRGVAGGAMMVDPRGRGTLPTPPGAQFPLGAARGGVIPPAGVHGGLDTFDLLKARSLAPPPIPGGGQGQAGGRDGDPRGRATQGRGGGGRFDGPNRYGVGPMDPMMSLGPVEKLKKTEKGWARNKEADDEVTAKVKQIRSLLNKLTLEKFDKIFKQIVDIDISSVEVLRGVVDEVFEKTLFEPKFASMYAELCRRLDESTLEMLQQSNFLDSKGKPLTFRKILLKNCQDEFTRFAKSGEEAAAATEPATAATTGGAANLATVTNGSATEETPAADAKAATPGVEEEKKADAPKEKTPAELKAAAELKERRAKQRMLANVRFIGELFIKNLLSETIIHKNCVQRLLSLGVEKKEDDVLEALCKLLSSTGQKLSANPKATQFVEGYFSALGMLSRDHTLPARVRFMLQDLIEQRANGWKARREESGAKTIAEIRKDIEKEERVKAEAQAAARDRRGRGGGGGGYRDRGPSHHAPRVAMTMANRQSAGAAVSRSTAMLEKHAGVSTAGSGANLPNVRLGPSRGGAGGANGWSSGAGGGASRQRGAGGAATPTLRPANRFNAFSALNDSKDSGSAGSQSGDVRRVTSGNKWSASTRGRGLPVPEQVIEAPAVTLMDPEKVKRKSKSIVSEYWSIVDLTEAKECVVEEILRPNYPKFVEEALKLSLGTKVDDRELSIPLFVGLLEDTIPAADFIAGFKAVVQQCPDMEVDDPLAANYLARYIGAVAGTRKLSKGEEDVTFGLSFLADACAAISDGKKLATLIIMTFHRLEEALVKHFPDATDRQSRVRTAFKALDIDLPAKLNDWNPVRGAGALRELLQSWKSEYLLPLVPIEESIETMLSSGKTGDEIYAYLKDSGVSESDLKSEEFVRLMVRLSFTWLFMDPPEKIAETFSRVPGKVLTNCFGESLPRDLQMAALLETQLFLHKNATAMPGMKGKEDKERKAGYVAFDALYDADVVEEETLNAWKEDTALSMKIEGKKELMLQTSLFFKWLDEAEEE